MDLVSLNHIFQNRPKCAMISRERGGVMGCLYWLFIGWWLEPILLIPRLIFALFVELPLKIIKWFVIIAVGLAVGTLLAEFIGAALLLGALVALIMHFAEKKCSHIV